ncbi:hypothetical protein N7478_005553 [Penicillium angulare]|uniref:uncharacterized protein n=1 Tax=Penicillium angulare TaxID=116970 RepID=UPI0025409E82|nr:uncharacterized protein N7478_005553 [Penicillium angulare]KAJ5280181.1 hypothetical protein N7478_005553 [Penicillium angulare]
MFWQAYQMDADSDEKVIAKSCASDKETQSAKLGSLVGGRCNFRQFLYYIADGVDEKANIKKTASNIGDETNIDKLANNMYSKEIKGAYRPGQIYENVPSKNVPLLFKSICEFVGMKSNDENNKLVLNARFARNRVQEGRVAGRNRDVGYLLRWDFDKDHQPSHNGVKFDPRKQKTPRDLEWVTEGLVPEVKQGRGWETVDLQQAKANILADPRYKGQSLKIAKYFTELHEIEKERKADADLTGHQPNIQALMKGKRGMATGSCEKKK